nr:hypothetical protein [Myxococcota bacterium]
VATPAKVAPRAPLITPSRTGTAPSLSPPTDGRQPASKRPAQGTPPDRSLEHAHDLQLPNPTQEELLALAENVELTDHERRRILAMARLVNDPWALLGVAQGSEALVLKRAYFQLSKVMHPDRFFGKRLGTFAHRMNTVFEATSRAYAKLTGTDKGRGGAAQTSLETGQQPQTPQAYAAELFERACQLEVGGDALGAMKLFAAAVRVDPQLRYLRRAASCALAAEQPKSAVEYAKKANSLAPNDVSSARLLAGAFRAAGKLADAEEVLLMAMALKSENDVLTAELRNDLAEVRRQLSQP